MKAFISSIVAAGVATLASIPAAIAGPYFNSEINSGFLGSQYQASVIDNHIGYEGAVSDGLVSYYIQGGPALLVEDGSSTEVEMSGKAGGNITISPDKLDLYGEVSFLTGEDDPSYGTKLGLKFKF